MRTVTDDEMLASIAEAPTDDMPRLVYADWLLQKDDALDRARGEYIALACSPTRSAARTARMKTLFDECGAKWLGPIAESIGEHVWARGFLDACEL